MVCQNIQEINSIEFPIILHSLIFVFLFFPPIDFSILLSLSRFSHSLPRDSPPLAFSSLIGLLLLSSAFSSFHRFFPPPHSLYCSISSLGQIHSVHHTLHHMIYRWAAAGISKIIHIHFQYIGMSIDTVNSIKLTRPYLLDFRLRTK